MNTPSTGISRIVPLVHGLMEIVVLSLIALSPWAFAAVHPLFEFVLTAGVAILTLLWAVCILVEGRFTWWPCPVAFCLAALVLFGLVQLVPLPEDVLRTLSPQTAAWLQDLLPPTTEQVDQDSPAAVIPWSAGASLSLSPTETRRVVVRLLAVFLLFTVVRNNLTSPGALFRLAVVALVDSVLLSLFALVQLFTSPPFQIYWTYPTGGAVFGPFICRNHFPFFVNLGIGLGIGLFLASRQTSGRHGRDPEPLLRNPAALWILTALVFTITGVAFSLSRGGLLALGVSLVVGGVLLGRATSRLRGVGTWAIAAVAVLGLVAWMGLPQLEARWAPLLQGELTDGRLTIWSHGLAIAKAFPLCGTGYGTFRHVESTQRGFGENWRLYSEYAHNDYLEALVEGGVVRLALSLAAVAWLVRLGYRAWRRHQGRPLGGLALGALIGFVSVAVHSFVDFGLHMPAIAFFVTVLCAHLASLGAAREAIENPIRLGGIASLLAAGLLALFAGLLVTEAGAQAQAERFRLAAFRRSYETDLESRRQRAVYLATAVRISPTDADLRLELAEAHRALWEQQPDSRTDRSEALRQYLAARDLNPLLAAPNVRLAALRDHLHRAEPALEYLRRAARLRPADPQIWYLLGIQEIQDGERDPAWQSWKNSLACSDRYRDDILRRAAQVATDAEIVTHLLSDSPERLLEAAHFLHPEPPEHARRLPYLERALRLIQEQGGHRTPEALRLEGKLQGELGQLDQAVATYRLALGRAPQEKQWRLELARYLADQGNLEEAKRECLRVLQENPETPSARQLLQQLSRQGREP